MRNINLHAAVEREIRDYLERIVTVWPKGWRGHLDPSVRIPRIEPGWELLGEPEK